MKPFVIFLLLSPAFLFAQTPAIDSMKKAVVLVRSDTERVYLFNDISAGLSTIGQNDEAIRYANKALLLSANFNGKEVWVKGIALSYRELGITYSHMGNNPMAVKNHLSALRAASIISDKKSMGSALGNLGNIHYKQGNYPQALQYYFKALKIFEELESKRGINSVYNNMGLIYLQQKNYDAALDNFNKGMALSVEMKDAWGVSGNYSYIGRVYKAKGDLETALKNFRMAMRIDEENKDEQGMALNHTNIADLFAAAGKIDSAALQYRQAIALQEKVGDKHGLVVSLNSLGTLLVKNKKVAEGEKHLLQALDVSKITGNKAGTKESFLGMAIADSSKGKYKNALDNYKNFIAYRDSLVNEDNTKKTVQLEMQYEFDKKEEATRLEQDQKDALAAADKKRQKIILLAVSGLGLIVLGFGLFAYRSFLQKKRANIEIGRQKHIIEEKQKEILDSIYYARRIQRSLITSEKSVQGQLRKLMRKEES